MLGVVLRKPYWRFRLGKWLLLGRPERDPAGRVRVDAREVEGRGARVLF